MAWFVCWGVKTRSGHCGAACRVTDDLRELVRILEEKRNVVIGLDLYELSRAAVELCKASRQ